MESVSTDKITTELAVNEELTINASNMPNTPVTITVTELSTGIQGEVRAVFSVTYMDPNSNENFVFRTVKTLSDEQETVSLFKTKKGNELFLDMQLASNSRVSISV